MVPTVEPGDEKARHPLQLETARIRQFRSVETVEFRLGPVNAFVGQTGAGKSNLLAAMRALLDPHAVLTKADSPMRSPATIRVRASLPGGRSVSVESDPTSGHQHRDGTGPPVLFLPGRLRDGPIVAKPLQASPRVQQAARLIHSKLAQLAYPHGQLAGGQPDAAPAEALVEGLEACCDANLQGVILLVEEPELYLRPQAQRYLYRLFHRFASLGNQVLYSTHSPAFLNVARLGELILVERSPAGITTAGQPQPLAEDDELRALGEFDAERSELLLSRAAILVEGRTEKLVLPFIFEALGHDIDREAISVVDCRGKANIPLFARVCDAVGISCVAVHDRDASTNERASSAETILNDRIRTTVGEQLTIELTPDFEGVAGLRGQEHKPARAWRYFKSLSRSDVPSPLARIVEVALAAAETR